MFFTNTLTNKRQGLTFTGEDYVYIAKKVYENSATSFFLRFSIAYCIHAEISNNQLEQIDCALHFFYDQVEPFDPRNDTKMCEKYAKLLILVSILHVNRLVINGNVLSFYLSILQVFFFLQFEMQILSKKKDLFSHKFKRIIVVVRMAITRPGNKSNVDR